MKYLEDLARNVEWPEESLSRGKAKELAKFVVEASQVVDFESCLAMDDNARRKTCRFHNTQRGCKFGDKCRFLHVDKEEKPKEKKTNKNKGPSKQTRDWVMNNRDAVVAMLELAGSTLYQPACAWS